MDACQELEEKLEELSESRKTLLKSQRKYQKDNDKFLELQKDYEHMDQAFRDGQAGVLAESLKEGEPCPVCGSVSHPKPAERAKEVPEKADLETAKKKAEEARETSSQSALTAGKQKGELESQEKELKNVAIKILHAEDLDEIPALLEAEQNRLSEQQKQVKKDLKTERINKKRKQELDETIPEAETALQELRERIRALQQSLTATSAGWEEKKVQEEILKQKLLFVDKSAAEGEIEKKQQVAEQLQKNCDDAAKQYEEQEKTIHSLQGQMQGYEATLDKAPQIDKEAVLKKRCELIDSQKQLQDANKIIASRIQVNGDIRDNLLKTVESLGKKEKRLQWVSALADTAGGKLSGKERIMLETYVQMTYFDRVIERANLRFMKMSGGQYELKRARESSDGRSRTGLELSVVDHYNGTERSVKTLSGGESFMASLSLALGLSDEVQSSAGGIQIDTMFVDEGFGSLDSDALEQAYRALAGLTEGKRLVGIISHVTDLKEKIERQLVVTKEKAGGSTVQLRI
jgi:exonuclease SbcC